MEAWDRFWEKSSFRIRVTVVAALLVLTLGLVFLAQSFNLIHQLSQPPNPPAKQISHFNLIIPASDPNVDLCKALLSAAVLNYPPPILVGWNATGKYDAKASHLAKILTVQRYLDAFPPERGDDLVLVVDGHDVWFQLPAEIMIQRYYELTLAANRRLLDRYGVDALREGDLRQTTLFGPDKVCWPVDYGRPACWAVPDAGDLVPKNAFGPSTDDGSLDRTRPRWLNSGTIMGPLRDVQAIFAASAQKMVVEYHPDFESRDSDQYYMANLFGEQEYARELLRPNKTSQTGEADRQTSVSTDIHVGIARRGADDQPDFSAGGRYVPIIRPGQRTEFHIGIDYQSSLFQVTAGYAQHLSWMTLNHTSQAPAGQTTKLLHQLDLSDDLLRCLPPFHPLKNKTIPWGNINILAYPHAAYASWRDVPLGTNAITGHVPALFHLTGDKSIRETWWPRMWFFPHGEAMLNATAQLPRRAITVTPDGREWWAGDRVGAKRPARGKQGGVWPDLGEWMEWSEVCKQNEWGLFKEGRECIRVE